MTCSNCGKEISFVGNVCPYCHVDKTGDQVTQMTATVGGIGLAIGGGALLGLWGAVGGFGVGIALGIALGRAVARSKK